MEKKLPYLPRNLKIGDKIDDKFDIFCLGVAIYMLCVGYNPSLIAKYYHIKIITVNQSAYLLGRETGVIKVHSYML